MIIYSIDRFTYLEMISFSTRGGGVFLKFFELLNFDVKLLMSLVSFFALIILDYLFQKERINNYFLLIIIIFSLPLYTLFQKYLDPLVFLLFSVYLNLKFYLRCFSNNISI